MKHLEESLKRVSIQSENRLEQWLIANILEAQEPEIYLNDILKTGCESGIISELIYYADIYPFFQEYYLEVQELLLEYQDEGGIITLKGDIQTHLTWFAIELTALRLSDKLGLG